MINAMLASLPRRFPGEVYYFNIAPYVTPGNHFDAMVDGQICRTSDGLHFFIGGPAFSQYVQTRCGADLQAALLIPSGGAILIYVIGSAAGIRLLPRTGLRRLMPWASLALSAAVFPFVGAWALAAVLLAGAAWCWPRRA